MWIFKYQYLARDFINITKPVHRCVRIVAYARLCIASGSIAPLLRFAATASIADYVHMCASRDNTKLCHMQFIVGFNSMRVQFNSI